MYKIWRIMQSMNLFHKILILLVGVAISLQAVPPVLNYAGQVAVNGEAFDGNGLFKFALVNDAGTTTYWSNDGTSVDGSEPQASVAVPVNGGLYAVLLGNTAQQGMGAIDPAIFAQHTDAKLRVWFSDGVNGFQQLSPDRPFASVPYAFNSESAKSADTALNAETAKTADSANVATTAMAVQAGAVTSSMLASNAVTSDKLSPQIKADINATIGMNRLSTEVKEKLNQEKTTTNYNAPSVGSLLAVPYGSDAPAGYSLFQRGEQPRLVWEEKAPVSVARYAYGGVEVLGGKIYFVGGNNGSSKNITERYDPATNTWEMLASMSVARAGVATAVLNGKFYAIGGQDLITVEVYDPSTDSWSYVGSLPNTNYGGSAVAVAGKIYLFGGTSSPNQVLSFDPSSNQWSAKANMPTSRFSHKVVFFQNRIWAISGNDNGSASINVESYDLESDSWQTEASLNSPVIWGVAWVANGLIYIGGGHNGSQHLSSISFYDPKLEKWLDAGQFPEVKYASDSVVLNDKVYVIAGHNGSSFSNKVFAADLNASMEGVYDLYRKDGNAPVGTPVVQSEYADGSVTGSKMADGAVTSSKIASNTITTSDLSEQILKYLKPEITTQPQAQTVYAGGDVSFSVTAEGKYLTFQWKKDGVDLAGETNATLNITDANATLHDGNYSVVVSNDFGSVESPEILVDINTTWSTDGLVGWWKFDEGSGTVAYDSSGNGNDGSLTGGPTWATGKIGGALSFDGVDDYVLVNKDFGATLTISAWAKRSSGDDLMLWCFGNQQTGPDLYFIQNKLYLNTWDGSANLFGDFLPEINTWYNFSTIISLVETKQYINGTLLGSANYKSPAGKNFYISMKEQGQGDYAWNGSVDDVRIYDRALSAEEVQALYNLGQ
jgi:N-acetylneuraminic acid mutarotase